MKEIQIAEIQNKIKEKIELSKNLEKELNQLREINGKVKENINKKTEEIQILQKKIGELKIKNNKKKILSNNLKVTDFTNLEHQIEEEFLYIQKKISENLKDKYKVQNIERLIEQQRQLTISYISIKKLEISEEFYAKNNIKEGINAYENLNKLSKLGKLNYQNLKTCGPILTFRLTSNTLFNEIKEKACEILKISPHTYYLYDDSFNSMEVCLDENIQKYFSFYEPSDSTLPEGYVIFYLIVKLKDQYNLLTCQEKAMNKNEGGGNQSNIINSNFDLFNCVEKLNQGKILKGLNKYHYDSKDINEDFEKVVNEPENNFLCFLLVLILIILSFISVGLKYSKIKNLSKMNVMSHNFLNNREKFTFNEYSMYEYLKLLMQFDNINNELDNSSLEFFGITQYRFFKTKEKDCYESKENDLIKTFLNITNLKCYYSGFNKKGKDKTDISNEEISIKYEEKLDIIHTYKTFYGNFDKTGFIIRYNPYDKENASKTYEILEKIINSNQYQEKGGALLEGNIQGIELTFNLYEPHLNVFTANVILVQKSINGYPTISYYDIIPFISNIYENKKILKIFDIVRIIILIILFSNILIKIFQKIKKKETKKISIIILIIYNVLFRMKNLLLIFAFSFLVYSVSIFNKYKVDYQKYNNSPYFIDFYHYANLQKKGRSFELISLFLISLYSLKYSEFFSGITIIIICFKKCVFEYLLLSITIFCLLCGMTITTYYVYGSYIKEFSTYSYSVITNLKIIFFIEDTNTLLQLNNHFQTFTIMLLLFYIVILRFFFLNLFYPIFTEYLRFEIEQNKYLNGNRLSFKKKFELFFCGCFNIFGKKKKLFNDTIIDRTQQSSIIKIEDISIKE